MYYKSSVVYPVCDLHILHINCGHGLVILTVKKYTVCSGFQVFIKWSLATHSQCELIVTQKGVSRFNMAGDEV